MNHKKYGVFWLATVLLCAAALSGCAQEPQEQVGEVTPELEGMETETAYQGGTYLATYEIIDIGALEPVGKTADGRQAYIREGTTDDQIYIEDENGLFGMWVKEGTDLPLADCPDWSYSVNGVCRVGDEESIQLAIIEIEDYPTFSYDGQYYSLEHTGTEPLSCDYCWRFTFEFTCQHTGYGDRSGQELPREITKHTAEVDVQQGLVVSMVFDGVWDEREQRMLG